MANELSEAMATLSTPGAAPMTASHQSTSTDGSESCKTMGGGQDWQDRLVNRACLVAFLAFVVLVLEGAVK
jgi:hypothetical protein